MAQKTITTLQNLIEEKNEQLARKDRLIDKIVCSPSFRK